MTETPEHSDPRAVVDRLVAAMLGNDPVAAAAVYSDDVVIVDPLFDVVGRDAAVTAFAAWFDAFRITSLEVAESVVEGSRIALRWVWTAIHQGAYLDIPASGQEFRGWNVIFFDTRDGLITRDLSTWDCTQYLALKGTSEPGSDG